MVVACWSDTVEPVRISRIVACGLAEIGIYFLVLRFAWMFKLEEAWLPYIAHGIAALAAGAVIVRVGSGARYEPIAGALFGIALLAAISFASPRTFGWIALRSDAKWFVTIAIAAGSAVLAEIGARTKGGASGGLGIVMVLSTGVASCLIFLGGRVWFTLVGHAENLPITIVSVCLLGVIAAFVVQWVVLAERIVACASGTGTLILWQVIELTRRTTSLTPELVYFLIPIAVSLIGSYAAAKLRPRVVDDTLTAFD